jgi:hypothetical protein
MTPNEQLISTLDSDQYDIESMRIDDSNGNFSPEQVEDYLQTEIIHRSLINGQFIQAREQCERFGFYYPEMRRIAGLNPHP